MAGDFSHLLHAVLGFGAAGAAVVALASYKGGPWHRRAGWVFVAGMVVSALTAWMFMFDRPLPLAMVSATVTLYAIGNALLAVNPQWAGARRWEWGLLALIGMVMLGMLATAVNLYRSGSTFFPAPLAMCAIIGVFALLDWRYLRAAKVPRMDRLGRHRLFMALAMAQMVMAPTIIVAPDIGVPVPVIVFGSLLLAPLIYFGFGPAARRASARKVPADAT
ncbi:hypothetical protein K3181_02665 [Qipengyuania sp. YG27]|uniref:DUF2306 domain-containing protein n=1 Tax=Qipengyuania mesophila TaxID=2867246 RepID=A0ABS7JRR7_9SPHN|nr:hypothetical protein [Qipengyuania mesophila]MBX7500347.1 hypothetical protein [Qipengyuania mesophila]